MAILVPDVSVIIKWVVPPDNEAQVEQALALRQEIAWKNRPVRLPALWFYEVGNILARRFPEQAQAQMAGLLALGMEEQPMPLLLEPALDLVRRYGVTFHDASYHATALINDGLFVTSDQRYLEKAAAAGHIQLLADWRPA
jgi:predicted nucleic acid-binding protein